MLEAARASNFSVEQEVWPVEEAKKIKCHLYVSHVAMEGIIVPFQYLLLQSYIKLGRA